MHAFESYHNGPTAIVDKRWLFEAQSWPIVVEPTLT